MRENFLNFDPKESVLVVESVIKHTAIGKTYWVMSRHHRKIMQVSEEAGGKNLSKLVEYGDFVEDEKQSKCTRRAKELLIENESVYLPSKRDDHTYLFKRKRNILGEPNGRRKPRANPQ